MQKNKNLKLYEKEKNVCFLDTRFLTCFCVSLLKENDLVNFYGLYFVHPFVRFVWCLIKLLAKTLEAAIKIV